MIPKDLHKAGRSFDYNKLSDDELMRLISKGEDAFYEVYKRYWQKLFVYAYNLLEDRAVCEDIIQDIFTDFWKKKDKIAIANLSHYLYQSVKFQVFNVFRNGKIAKKHVERMRVVQFVNSTEESLNLKELENVLHDLLSQLPDRCREIFYASRFENLSYAEISEKFNISNQTVKNQISTALKHLRDSLDAITLISLALLF
ncbi:MAG: RNA polymerase sigma-70 factor [Cyclobacteriaceae bacterium]